MRWDVLGHGYAALIPDARFCVLPGADHPIQHDAPATVAVKICACPFSQHERLELS